MAATQAEKQQNDVNSEKVQPDQHINVRNSLLQNGTDKSGVRAGGSVVISKSSKNSSGGGKNLPIEMSQYRQDGNSGGPTVGPAQPGGPPCGSETSDIDLPASGAPTAPGGGGGGGGNPGAEAGPYDGPPPGDGYGFPYSRDAGVHNSGEGVHAFGPRHPFGGPKQQQQQPPMPNFSQPPQPRFVSGQAISQPTGPTPTLNQLLQSSNPMPHRYQNSYEQSYNQGGWSQKPLGSYGGGPTLAPTATPAYRTQGAISSPYGGSAPSSYGDSGRAGGWPGHSVPPQHQQHPPSSPGPPSSTAPASQPSPQPAAPSHSPGPGSGLPPSPQHQGFPNRPAQPTTPNTHGPDAADLSGGNSNDSSGGPIPGTPNSQGMRPTPSPTGSTGSRSMSPAVGQQNVPMPPRPSSGPSDSGAPSRISHSPIGTAPGSYPQTHQSPHPPHGYKAHPGMTPSAPPTSQQMPLYQPNQQYPQGYAPRSQQYPNQGYGPPVSQAPPSNNMPNQQQYQNRQPNHMPNSQFPPYQQGWPTPPPNAKGNGPPQAPTSPRPPHYLKHHLQHKMGFGAISGTPPSPGPPQNYHMGPPPPGHHHSGMGPPNNPGMGPPNIPSSGAQGMPNSHAQQPHDGPMPPPSSTPNSHSIPPDMMDNGITTTAQSGMAAHVSTASSGSVTSVVTTGPDGAPIDEGSQQSTLSNASAASGEDPQCTTPKSGRKNDIGGHYSHPTTPQSTVPSPGAASMNSMHEDYSEISSPSWPRTPASPKTDSLGKLYEMDDSPDRRGWLDKLLAFMDERRTPITTCPTISKNPLDLFRLYVYVKERGGFMEVTKNKTWKDIAGMLGIGASSSAAYTLRKHYTKNLLAFECHFDRGGIDPQPIINQVEASSKKKSSKAASVPSPGSSNSQDSFPPPGSGGGSMDGYGYGYPPNPNQDYNTGQRPSSQANAPSPHGGSGSVNHLNSSGAPSGPSPAGGAGDNVNVSNPFDDVSPSPPPRGGSFAAGQHPPYPTSAPPRQQGQNYTGNQGGGYNQYPNPIAGPGGAPTDQYSPYSSSSGYPPSIRPVYPPYSGSDSGAPSPSPGSAQTPPAGNTQDHYNRYGIGNTPTANYQPRPTYGATPTPNVPPPTSQPPAGPYAPQQDYYRPDQPGAPPNSSSYQQPKNMPPPGPQPPRRHPDFAKDQQNYSQYGQNRPQMYNWSNNNQFRPAQFSGSGGPPAQQWQGGRPSGQWERYPPPNQPYPQGPPGQQQWNAMSGQVPGQNSPMRTPMGPRSGKPFSPQMLAAAKSGQPQPQLGGSYTTNQVPKREITFPPDSVEATVPVIYRRKKLCKQDLGPVDAWRIIMSLRSGLLAESTFAIDMLNILLYDDSSVSYFGLSQWPSLLDLLLEHFRKCLSDIFDHPFPKPESDNADDPDLGNVIEPIDPDKKTVLLKETHNYSTISRKGDPVKIEKCDDLFVRDHRKSWDIHGDAHESDLLKEIDTDPFSIYADYLLPPFQAEFGRIPFHMRLKDTCKKEEETYRPPTPPPDEAPPPTSKPDRKRRTKTLNDVISRIKKDNTTSTAAVVPAEVNDTKTLKTETIDNIKTEEVVCEKASLDLSVSVNGELKSNEENVRESSSKRRRTSDFEDEAYVRDDASLVLLTESQDNLGKRCVCMSNIIRSLTFVPGNELEFSKNATFLKLVGKLLLLHHSHPPRTQKTRNYDREEDADFADSCSSLQGEGEWWWDFLQQIRENILVSLANIAGQIDVSQFSEEVARPLLDGLLHWAICPSASGQDPFPSVGPSSLLSPQRLALEALCKLCVTNCNVDLVIATPPFSRLERLCAVLTKHLCRSEDQVLREFSINLLHYLAAADSSLARVVASQTPCVSLLVAFIEHAEQSALGVANQHGITALRDNPDSMGTSLDMLRRAAATLVFLAQHPDNRALLVQQEARLLALVMSQILDQQVALLLSKVLFQISRS